MEQLVINLTAETMDLIREIAKQNGQTPGEYLSKKTEESAEEIKSEISAEELATEITAKIFTPENEISPGIYKMKGGSGKSFRELSSELKDEMDKAGFKWLTEEEADKIYFETTGD